MRVTILGATGFVGRIVTAKALSRGHSVTVLARSPNKLGDLAQQISVIQGDLFDSTSVHAAIREADAVVSCAGPQPKAEYEPAQYQKAMQEVLAAMRAENVRRIITLGGAATVRVAGEREEFSRKLLRFIFGLLTPRIVKAKQLEYDTLSQSDVEWTVLRPPMIVADTSTGEVRTDEHKSVGSKVAVDDLAEFMLDQLDSGEWIHRAPLVASVWK